MTTTVVSGRVEEDVKRRVDAIIRAAGSSVTKVISDVWYNIATTGQLPVTAVVEDDQDAQRKSFESFLRWFAELPPQNEEYAHVSDEEILSCRVSEHV